MRLEPIDEFAEKAPDIEQLQTLLKKNTRRFKTSFIVATVIFFTGWLLALLVVRNQFLFISFGYIIIGLVFLLLLAQTVSVATTAWFYLKKETNRCDMESKETGRNVLVANAPLHVVGACLCIYFFVFVVDNYANVLRRIMPFDNNQVQELAAVFFLSLFWVAAGLLCLAAAIRLCLQTYTSTYDFFEHQDKVKVCFNTFIYQLIYSGGFFALFVLLALELIDIRFLNSLIGQNTVYVAFTVLVVAFYTFCKFVGTGLLLWDMKSRRYDGL